MEIDEFDPVLSENIYGLLDVNPFGFRSSFGHSVVNSNWE